MSLIRPDGVIVQFDAEDLIVRIKEDIKQYGFGKRVRALSLIHISEPTRH